MDAGQLSLESCFIKLSAGSLLTRSHEAEV